MVKKVEYTLIDTKLLPADMVCRNNAFEQFVGLDDYFLSEWLQLTNKMNEVKNQIMKEFDLFKQSGRKSDLYFSFNNRCGLLLVE